MMPGRLVPKLQFFAHPGDNIRPGPRPVSGLVPSTWKPPRGHLQPTYSPYILGKLVQQLDQSAFSQLTDLPTSAWMQLPQVRKHWTDEELARALGVTLAELQQLKKQRAEPDALKRENYTVLLLS